MATLLQRALKYQPKKTPGRKSTRQEVELAIAWAEGRISLAAAAKQLGYKPNSGSGVYIPLAHALAYQLTHLK